MNIFNVNGLYSPNQKSPCVDNVLYLPHNNSHFDLALIIAEASCFQGYIYAEGFELKARDYISQNPFSNLKFILDSDSVAGILLRIKKTVVFVGYVIPFGSKPINKIVSTCLKVQIPIYEIPHGMFQTGINISDNSKLISTHSFYEGFGGALPSISDMKLHWFGVDGFGYPRTSKKDFYKKRTLPKFTLITSNTNWYLYSPADKRLFFKQIFDYAKNNPNEIFIWCAHPAELTENAYSFYASNHRPRNIYLYGIDKQIYFDGLEGADDLIPYCEYGISTVTTCLLDYEIHNKRVNIFSCAGVSEFIEQLSDKRTFTTCGEISSQATYLRSGFIKNFDSKIYDAHLSKEINLGNCNKHHFLSSFLRHSESS